MLNRVHVAQNLLPQVIEAALQLLVGLALELSCLSLCLTSDLVRLALCLAGDLARLALGLSGGVWSDLLHGLGDFLCTDCQHDIRWQCQYLDREVPHVRSWNATTSADLVQG